MKINKNKLLGYIKQITYICIRTNKLKTMCKNLFEISTADDLQDVQEGCYDGKERGLFTAANALRVLENGNGGTMYCKGVGNYGVSHIPSQNDWLRTELKKKKLI